jgi:hypothetical protein
MAVQARILVGLVVATVILGGCTTASSAPKSSVLAVTAPRCPNYLSFGVSSFAKDHSTSPIGTSSPVTAARSLADEGLQPRIPRLGWHVTTKTNGTATVVSGNTILHAIRVSDGSWVVNGGKTCT